MKKTLQAAVLIVLAASAIGAAALSPHSRANKKYPPEWENIYSNSRTQDSFFINYSKTTNK